MFFITISLRISQISFLKLLFIIASPGSLFQTFFFLNPPMKFHYHRYFIYLFIYSMHGLYFHSSQEPVFTSMEVI